MFIYLQLPRESHRHTDTNCYPKIYCFVKIKNLRVRKSSNYPIFELSGGYWKRNLPASLQTNSVQTFIRHTSPDPEPPGFLVLFIKRGSCPVDIFLNQTKTFKFSPDNYVR